MATTEQVADMMKMLQEQGVQRRPEGRMERRLRVQTPWTAAFRITRHQDGFRKRHRDHRLSGTTLQGPRCASTWRNPRRHGSLEKHRFEVVGPLAAIAPSISKEFTGSDEQSHHMRHAAQLLVKDKTTQVKVIQGTAFAEWPLTMPCVLAQLEKHDQAIAADSAKCQAGARERGQAGQGTPAQGRYRRRV